MQTPSTLNFEVSPIGRSKTTLFSTTQSHTTWLSIDLDSLGITVSIRGVSSINRVYEMKVLGVTFSGTFSPAPHVKYLSAKSAQTVFALRTLHTHSLSGKALWTVTRAHIISWLTYACSAWWGFCNSGEKDQLAAVVTRLVKKNYLHPDQPTLHEMVATADIRLFNQIVVNSAHVLGSTHPTL